MANSELVTDYMTLARNLITFTPEMDIMEATKMLLIKKISGAPVVNKDGKLVGILSEKDCIHLLIDGMYNQRPVSTGTVAEFMSTNITSLDASKTIVEAAYEFIHCNFRRFPITQNGKLLGQISRRDVLKAIVQRRPSVKHTPSSWKVREPIS